MLLLLVLAVTMPRLAHSMPAREGGIAGNSDRADTTYHLGNGNDNGHGNGNGHGSDHGYSHGKHSRDPNDTHGAGSNDVALRLTIVIEGETERTLSGYGPSQPIAQISGPSDSQRQQRQRASLPVARADRLREAVAIALSDAPVASHFSPLLGAHDSRIGASGAAAGVTRSGAVSDSGGTVSAEQNSSTDPPVMVSPLDDDDAHIRSRIHTKIDSSARHVAYSGGDTGVDSNGVRRHRMQGTTLSSSGDKEDSGSVPLSDVDVVSVRGEGGDACHAACRVHVTLRVRARSEAAAQRWVARVKQAHGATFDARLQHALDTAGFDFLTDAKNVHLSVSVVEGTQQMNGITWRSSTSILLIGFITAVGLAIVHCTRVHVCECHIPTTIAQHLEWCTRWCARVMQGERSFRRSYERVKVHAELETEPEFVREHEGQRNPEPEQGLNVRSKTPPLTSASAAGASMDRDVASSRSVHTEQDRAQHQGTFVQPVLSFSTMASKADGQSPHGLSSQGLGCDSDDLDYGLDRRFSSKRVFAKQNAKGAGVDMGLGPELMRELSSMPLSLSLSALADDDSGGDTTDANTVMD